MTQNLWDAATAVLRGKLMTIKSYLKKQETSQINNLTLYLKKLKREEPKPLKVSRRKEIIKIKAEIIEKEMNKTIAKINKTKSQFFEKIKKQTYHQSESLRKKGRRLKLIKLEMKKKLQLTLQKCKGS